MSINAGNQDALEKHGQEFGKLTLKPNRNVRILSRPLFGMNGYRITEIGRETIAISQIMVDVLVRDLPRRRLYDVI